MFDFRAIIDETDIVNYVKTLILPPYMSYLKIEPFRFSEQVHNTAGRESLRVAYAEEGRLEEVQLSPEDHALPILTSLALGLDPNTIEIPKDSVWTWTPDRLSDISYDENGNKNGTLNTANTMNLFFNPRDYSFDHEYKGVLQPHQAYISVSKQILYIELSVVKRYILERIGAILLPDSPMQLKIFMQMEKCPTLSDKKDDLYVTLMADGYRFQCGRLAGEMIFDSGKVFYDLVRFAKLDQAYKYIEEYIQFDWMNTAPRFSKDGILFEPISQS